MQTRGSARGLGRLRGRGEQSSPPGLPPRPGLRPVPAHLCRAGRRDSRGRGLGAREVRLYPSTHTGLRLQRLHFFAEFTRTRRPCHRPEMPASHPSPELASSRGGDPPSAPARQAVKPQMALGASAPRPQARHESFVGCLSPSCFCPSQVNPSPDPRSLGTQGCSVDTGLNSCL